MPRRRNKQYNRLDQGKGASSNPNSPALVTIDKSNLGGSFTMHRVWRRLRAPSSITQHCRLRGPSRTLFDTSSPGPETDPHSYTSGKWLHRDELQRNSRYILFDFPALCQRAIDACPGATRAVKCEKREGGFNRVFLFTMDNGSCAVARTPTGITGPPRLTTNSEVATMTYCRPSRVPVADMPTDFYLVQYSLRSRCQYRGSSTGAMIRPIQLGQNSSSRSMWRAFNSIKCGLE